MFRSLAVKGIRPPCSTSHSVSKGRSGSLGVSLGRGWRNLHCYWQWALGSSKLGVTTEGGDRPLKPMTTCLQRRWAAKGGNNLSNNPGSAWKWCSWGVLCREQSFSTHVALPYVCFSECSSVQSGEESVIRDSMRCGNQGRKLSRTVGTVLGSL